MHAKAEAAVVSALAIRDRSRVRNAGFVLAIGRPAGYCGQYGAFRCRLRFDTGESGSRNGQSYAGISACEVDLTGYHLRLPARWLSRGHLCSRMECRQHRCRRPTGESGRRDARRGLCRPVNIAMRNLTPTEAEAIGEDAYIYGYPLITMDLTRQVTTNVAAPEGLRAPVGQFANAREYPTAAFRDVTAPNARHTLFERLARPLQGAVHPELAGRG